MRNNLRTVFYGLSFVFIFSFVLYGAELTFTPPYHRAFWGEKPVLAAQAEAEQVADPKTGLLAVWAGAWIGGTASYACHEIWFEVPYSTAVRITVDLAYAGTDLTVGAIGSIGLFAGLQFIYFIDGQGNVLRDLTPGLWVDLVENLIDAGFFALGVAQLNTLQQLKQFQQLLKYLKMQWQNYKIMSLLTNLSVLTRGIRERISFSLSLGPGRHRLAVGLQAAVSATALGNSYAAALARIERIRIKW
ncbi:MAG TPA: hypothetical protein ENG73_01010 [Desulfobacterales bacterium]|nr:MAG: hypothetical protein DRN68_04205 [Nitrososphaerota archaeon]HDG96742.1 hypothetical protein [Desulfobacterales bacterium]